MNPRPVIVVDPGHGGTVVAGGSSPNHSRSYNGLLEKDLVLDLAQRVGRLLGPVADVRLTRASDANLSLSERARLARNAGARLFVSLHFNGSDDPAMDGTRAWVARQAHASSRELAATLSRRLAAAARTLNRGVSQRDLGVLLPSRHAEGSSACLVEVAYLSNRDQAGRLADPAYRNTLAEAIGGALRDHVGAGAAASGLAVGAGRAEVDCPLLTPHGAAKKNLILRWNAAAASYTSLDVAVHFHGFGPHTLNLKTKEEISGLDPSRRSRALLGFIPRGKNIGAVNKTTSRYDFPELTNNKAKGLEDLIVFGLDWFAQNQLSQPTGSIQPERFILTAHSGGGARLLRALAFHNPDEAQFFDAIYEAPSAAVSWVTRRIRQDAASLQGLSGEDNWPDFMAAKGGALRCLINPASSKLAHTTVLHDAIECELNRIADKRLRNFLAKYYRVEKTSVGHNDIPKTFGPQLLADAAADLTPAVTRLPGPKKCAAAIGSALETLASPCIPQRASGALSGRDIIKSLYSENPPRDWAGRENIFFDEITSGNIPDFLRTFKKVSVSFREPDGTQHNGTYRVMPDVLSIGNDLDFFRVPLDAITAQRIADALCCLLPTAKMVWDIYQKAEIRAVAIPRPYNDPKSKIKGTSIAAYAAHSDAIESALPNDANGKLIEGHKKMVVISNLLYQQVQRKLKDGSTKYIDGKKLLAFYGFFKSDGTPIQGGREGRVSMAHEPTFADYSQGVRLVHPRMEVDGASMSVHAVLAHPVLHQLLSNEGPVKNPRIPAKR